MSDYAIFFDKDSIVYQLPVNPEEMNKSSVLAIEKYEILKLGQIAVPTHMELTEYSFECEFPSVRINPLSGIALGMGAALGLGVALGLGLPSQNYLNIPHYVETSGSFKGADFYLNLFAEWRNKLVPVRFIASNGIGDDINSLVLIEELEITEKAGEEGDKYVSFKLLEYRPFGKKTPDEIKITSEIGTKAKAKKKKGTTSTTNPKSTGYHIVRSGDNLWTIAKKYYGDGSKSNIIYNANKSKIKNPAIINIGRELKIPTKDEFSKYSAPLPVMKTEVKAPVYRGGPQGIAGIGSTLENYYG